MSKIEHKYDVGDVVLIPMRVSGVSADPGINDGKVVYALSPIGGKLNAFIRDMDEHVTVKNENYIYSEFKGEVPMRNIEELPMGNSSSDIFRDYPFGSLFGEKE